MQSSDKNDRLKFTLEVVKNFEANFRYMSDDTLEITRISIANSLQKFLTGNKHINYSDRYILSSFRAAKKFLHDNTDIMVTRADKGQTTVVMDKNDYLQKMATLLGDCSTYKKLKKDPIKQIVNRVHSLVKSWRDNDLIDESTYRVLNCTNGNLSRCYGLPKIHKEGCPLRIIVSSLDSPLYEVSRYIHNILHNSIKKPKSYIKDGWTFVKNIKNMTINDDDIMISLDVSSLFTNIPRELVFTAIENRWEDIRVKTKFSLMQLQYAIGMVLSSTSFQFNGQFYEQVYGSPMGSPLSPILADMVMEDLEVSCLGSLKFSVPVFHRYVDDIFTILPRSEVKNVLEIFDNYHERLKFTYEVENNASINFLNTNVIRDGKKLITNWFKKPTWSGRYINYLSSHPFKYKVNTIYNLTDCAILLSNKKFHHNNIETVKNILMNNGFPEHIIKKYVNRRINTLNNKENFNKHDTGNNDNIGSGKTHVIPLPYIDNVSDEINRSLKNTGIRVVYRIPKKLNTLIRRGKDKLPNDIQTNVVYRIDCNDCTASYVGQTKRHLRTRVKEHFNNIKMHETNHSVISKHKCDLRHDFNWASPVVLHNEKQVRKREIAEMFFIKKQNNTINLQRDTESLTNVYDKVIRVV